MQNCWDLNKSQKYLHDVFFFSNLNQTRKPISRGTQGWTRTIDYIKQRNTERVRGKYIENFEPQPIAVDR